MQLYQEEPDAGNTYREQFLDRFSVWLDREFDAASQRRAAFFKPALGSPTAYLRTIEPLRDRFRAMLGWPLTGPRSDGVPASRGISVAHDDLGTIERVWIEVFPGVELYGLLFVPTLVGPQPLVLSQHGGLGTPELTAGFFGSANYNDMTRRVLRRGAVVFAPQLFRWDAKFGRQPDVDELDRQMKQLGGSIAAFELACLSRALDYLVTRPEVDASRIGMIGLSYGGFHTLYMAAVDTRIRAALSSCFFNDRRRYGRRDWGFFNAANTFFDVEVASLVCPRSLCLEVAANDELFSIESARPWAGNVAELYDSLGIADRFLYREHAGRHELDSADVGVDFLFERLDADRRQE